MHDDKLILYYYDDGLSRKEKQQIESALANDAEFASRYQELRRQLSGFDEGEIPAVPTHVTQRWHDSIDRAARMENNALSKPASGFNFLSFFWGAAITASLAVGVAIGVYISGGGETAPPAMNDLIVDATPNVPTVIPAAFTRGLQVHLRDSQRNISTLSLQSDADRALLIMDILEQNRLFERAAERKNSPKLARVLRAFEPILVRLAADDLAPEDAEALRAQLAFELNVMLTKLARETSEEPQTI
jgi:hypothetical protein